MRNAGDWYATMPEEELEAFLRRDANLRRDWDAYYGDRMQKSDWKIMRDLVLRSAFPK